MDQTNLNQTKIELVKIYACDVLFYMSKENLLKSQYFKGLLSFEQSLKEQSFEEKANQEQTLDDSELTPVKELELKTDLEPDIFKYIVEHSKYNNIAANLTYIELKKIRNMANFLLYNPLMKTTIKPDVLDIQIIISKAGWNEAPQIIIKCDNFDYLQYCMEYANESFYINKITNKIGQDFLYETYFKVNVFQDEKIIERYYKLLQCIGLLRKDLKMSIGKIEMINISNKICAYITFIGDDLDSIPCTFKFTKSYYHVHDEKDSSKSIIILRDFSLDDFPMIYYTPSNNFN